MKRARFLIFSSGRSDFWLAVSLINSLTRFEYKVVFILPISLKNFHNEIASRNITCLFYSDKLIKKRQKFLTHFIKFLTEKLAFYQNYKVVVIGDRWESLIFTQVASTFDLKICHFSGGEVTLGSKDNSYRHSISLLSDFHFVPNREASRFLIKNLQISSENIAITGYLGVENVIQNIDFINNQDLIDEILKKYNLIGKIFCLVTYHPNTVNVNMIKSEFNAIVNALNAYKDLVKVITFPNNDPGSKTVIESIENLGRFKNFTVVKKLGSPEYFALLARAKFMIGNSSSGIVELPLISNTNNINVGDRQNGRVKHKNNYDVPANTIIITKTIAKIIKKDTAQEVIQHSLSNKLPSEIFLKFLSEKKMI